MMETMEFANVRNKLSVSRIALGCWRMDALSDADAQVVVDTALHEGINFFDHADIYAGGVSEEKFGRAWKKSGYTRDQILIQSKAGIAVEDGCYDFSKEHILQAVEGSLRRLQTDYLDVLLLHRPDTLFEPEEVAEAFDKLESEGKVRFFGVSNQNPTQIDLLKKYVKQDIVFNQMQFNVAHAGLVEAGMTVNNRMDAAIVRDGGALEYCRLHDIGLQAWSPFQYGFFDGIYLDNPKFPELNEELNRIANERNVTSGAVAAAWILRHPAFVQCIVGTMNPKRLEQLCRACEVKLSRKEWYALYKAAGSFLP